MSKRIKIGFLLGLARFVRRLHLLLLIIGKMSMDSNPEYFNLVVKNKIVINIVPWVQALGFAIEMLKGR